MIYHFVLRWAGWWVDVRGSSWLFSVSLNLHSVCQRGEDILDANRLNTGAGNASVMMHILFASVASTNRQ